MSEHKRFQRAERPGAGTLTITGGHAVVTIEASEAVDRAEVTVSQSTQTNPESGAFLDQVRLSSTGTNLTVTLPRTPGMHASGGGVVMSNVGSGVMVVGNTVIRGGGNMVVQSGGQTWVNGHLLGADSNVTRLPEPIRVVARLPIDSSLDLRLDSGDIKAAGSYDTVRSNSTSASVEVDTATHLDVNTTSGATRIDRAGDVNHRSVSGQLRVGSVESLRSGTTSGDVTAKQVHRRADTSSVSGDIGLHATSNIQISASTVSGDIDITTEPGCRPDVRHSTVSGRVRIR